MNPVVQLFHGELKNQVSKLQPKTLQTGDAVRAIGGGAILAGLEQVNLLAGAMLSVVEFKQLPPVWMEAVDFLEELAQLSPNKLPEKVNRDSSRLSDLIARLKKAQPTDSAPEPPKATPEPAPRAQRSGRPKRVTLTAVSASIVGMFLDEIETKSALLSEGLLGLEQGGFEAERIQEIMRAAHSIKGAASLAGFPVLVELAHCMEDLLVSIGDGSLGLNEVRIEALLQAVDAFSDLTLVHEEDLKAYINDHAQEFRDLRLKVEKARERTFTTVIVEGQSEDAVRKASQEAAQKIVNPPKPAPQPNTSGSRSSENHSSSERAVKVATKNLEEIATNAQELLGRMRNLESTQHHWKEIGQWLDGLKEALRFEAVSPSVHKMVQEGDRLLNDCITSQTKAAEAVGRTANRLYLQAMSSRMRRFGDGMRVFPRMVRDLAKQCGKKVQFNIKGESLEVDRDILNLLESPLTHLLRNAIDHGLEAPEERLAAGKKEEGSLTLEAQKVGGNLCIIVRDDGRGLCYESLRRKVVERQLMSQDMAARLTERELVDFLFLPGFSTAQKVSDISGRGVGLDAVHNQIHRVGGLVWARSEKGKSMAVHLRLPLTMATRRVLLVKVGTRTIALPLNRIVNGFTPEQFGQHKGNWITLPNSDQKRALDLAAFLELGKTHRPGPVICAVGRSTQVPLVVDSMLGHHDLVSRPWTNAGDAYIEGAVIQDDGQVVPVLDIPRLVDTLNSDFDTIDEPLGTQEHGAILIAEDTRVVRESIRRLLVANGYKVKATADGLEAWQELQMAQYQLLITDVDMPRLTGFELMERIRNKDHLKDMPIIVFTNKDRDDHFERGHSLGAHAYLLKREFNEEEFLDDVASALDKVHPETHVLEASDI